MLEPGTFTLGIWLLALGVIILALVAGLLWIARRQPHPMQPAAQPERFSTDSSLQATGSAAGSNEAVFVVGPGGKILSLNDTTRQWFQAWEELPKLELLAQRAYPTDVFLGLCAAAGQAQFTLDGQLLQGASYTIPQEGGQSVLVSLRQAHELLLDGIQSAADQRLLLAEFARKINANLELQPTLFAILDTVEQLIPADIAGLSLWDEKAQHLIPYRLLGMPGVDRRLEKAPFSNQMVDGFSNRLVMHRQPLLISDLQANQEIPTVPVGERIYFRSFLGVPLLNRQELVGTLEFIALQANSFQSGHLELLSVLSGLAAQAIKNAYVYEAEHNKAADLTGLTDLAQALQDGSDPETLFSRLTAAIYSLVDVDILGFLLYDETRRLFYGQNPFIGLPANVVDWRKTSIPQGSDAERLLLSAEYIHSEQPSEDPRLEALGLQSVAQAAGIRQTILAPLTSAGRVIGYLQAANPRSKAAFDDADIRRLVQITVQVSPIIDNAFLVHESRRRAQRAETLRRIASLTGSAATLDEMLKYSLLDLARLFQADVAVILLFDAERGELRPHWASLYGIEQDQLPPLSQPAGEISESPQTVTSSRRSLLSGDLAQESLHPFYTALVADLDLHSAIVVPLITRERGIGELLVASRQTDFYDHSDERSVLTAAGQLAAAIEQTTLYSQTDQNLRQRVDQLTALTRISRELNSTLDLSYLLQRVYDEALRTTSADCGTILLFELEFDEGQVEPRLLLHLGDRPAAEWGEQEKWVLHHNESLLVEDYDQPEGQNLPLELTAEKRLAPPHAGVHSSLLVPIAYQGQVAGLIWLHAYATHTFDNSARQISEALAIQAAIALGNAHRYEELFRRSELLNRRVEAFARLLETSRELRTAESLADTLEAIAYAIQAATPFDMVLISVMDPGSGKLQRISGAGIPLDMLSELRSHQQTWDAIQELLKPEFRLGSAYFIPYEQMPVLPVEVHSVTYLTSVPTSPVENQWRPDDMLLVPLLGADQGKLLGLVSVDAPRDHLRPDRTAIDALEIFASQAALAIETRQKLDSMASRLEAAERRAGLVQNAAQEADRQFPMLLQKDVEQTLVMQQLSHQGVHMQAGVAAMQAASTQITQRAALEAAGQELLSRLCFTAVLMAEYQAGGLQLIGALGELPAAVNPAALLGQRNPLLETVLSRQVLLVPDVVKAVEWQNTPLLHALEAQSFVCLPVLYEQQTLAGILAISQQPHPEFLPEDYELFLRLGQQLGVFFHQIDERQSINQRLREFGMLLDFSRRLVGLGSEGVLEILLESAFAVAPQAQAGWVATWDAAQAFLVPQVMRGFVDAQSLLKMRIFSGEGLPGQVYDSRQAVRLAEVDFAQHYSFQPDNLLRYRDATGGKPPISSLAIPISASLQSEPMGILVLDHYELPQAFSPDDQALINTLAQQAALTLENIRLLAETRSLTEDLEQRVALRTTELAAEHQRTETLLRIITELSASLDIDQVLQRTLNVLNEFIGAQKVNILLSQPGQAELKLLASQGSASSAGPQDIKEQEMAQQVLKRRAFLRMEDFLPDSEPAAAGALRSALAVPLMVGAEILGVLQLFSQEARHFTAGHVELVQAAANQIAVALNNAELYSLIRDQAEDLGGMLRSQQIETSRSRAILEAVADGVLVTDSQMKITLFNASAEKILGLPRTQVLGKSLEHFSGLFGSAAGDWFRTIQSWSHTPAVSQSGETYSEQLELENGHVVEVRLAPVSLRNDFLGTVSIFQDVTHQVEVDRLKSEFVATVSHELRTPMTSIKGYVEIMLMGAAGSLSDQQTHFLEVVRENADRLTVLVNDLLDISKIESGRIELLPQPLDMDELVSEALLIVEQRAAEDGKPIQLKKDIPLNLPRAWGDVERVRQVLENLLDNAYQYNTQGGSIEVLACVHGDEIQVDVKDSGLGIPPEEHERIFERFYRGENPLILGVSGTGLGLSIVQSLVHMQGGRIWLESQGIPGQGSTFSFTLPLYNGQENTVNEGSLLWQKS